MGPFTAPVLAVLPLLDQTDSVLIVSATAGISITHELFSPRVFRNGYTSVAQQGAEAKLVAQQNPDVTRWAAITMDSQAGEDLANGYIDGTKRWYKELHGREVSVAKTLKVKTGLTNFGNQIAELLATDAEGLFAYVSGAEGISFYGQAHTLGLDQKYKLISDGGLGVGAATTLKKNTPKNVYVANAWFWESDPPNPISQALYQEQLKVTSEAAPVPFLGTAHDSILLFGAALRSAGNTSSEAVIRALEDVDVDGAAGKLRFRKADHAMTGDLAVVNFGADPNAADGWRVFKTFKVSATDLLEPPTPGRKLEGG
jgi:branched-chain amino acid transport system substrate-binding protein